MDQANVIYPPGHESAPDSTPTPTVTPKPSEPKQRSGLKKALIFVLVLVLIGGVGYGVYYWQQQQVKTLNTEVNTLTVQAAGLNKQITTLNAQVKADTKTAAVANQNVIKITNLGIQITVPDSIKDLTFTTSSTTESGLSTASLTSKNATCSATDMPLGNLNKATGTYPANPTINNAPGALVKQFNGFYIAYSSPQAACSNDTLTNGYQTTQLDVLRAALPTVTQITN
jgi:outer membrane murein-binding lipoprotein Lpp